MIAAPRRRARRRRLARGVVAALVGVAPCAVVVVLLVVPAVLLQVGLRDATEPVVPRERLHLPDRDRRRPRPRRRQPVRPRLPGTGLERFYAARQPAPPTSRPQVALTTSPTSPAPCSPPRRGASSRPRSTTTASSSCSPRSPAPSPCSSSRHRCHGDSRSGAALAANPLAIKAAWFGTADATGSSALAPRLRSRGALALGLGRRPARRRGPAQAVRARRAARSSP